MSMPMHSVDWDNWARVIRAGAQAQRRYEYNIERQQQAESLEAQAEECAKIAKELRQVGR